MSKQAILSRVKSSLQSNPIPTFAPHYKNIMIKNEDKIQEYINYQSANKAIVHQSNEATLAKDLQEILSQTNAQKVLYNPNIDVDMETIQGAFTKVAYTQSVDEIRDELFGIDTSIIQANCGVANLGIIGITSGLTSPRLSSLITNTCIVLLKKQNIVENLYEGVKFLRGDSNVAPTNLILIAGPSRTADIELQTVFGVHGSRNTHVILY
ncbi:lactate utilization protein C [Helicobacter sp. MIT 05-5293]|uniref:LutC/YkgG family protein n=1 Tax=Helicobacter sp. MIT 05-5293 TaxID=1548149 RepID=UPI00051DFADA|nr:lactate utilization protein C [Helicobacter sp. MIT 05-5293]TLD80233.1 lactate utilization protein C [Helicobacter sp. MIT 05-5293]